MDTYSTVIELEELSESNQPENWLSPAEWQHCRNMEQRGPFLRTWLGGRWCVKQVVRSIAANQGLHATDIHIESLDARERRTPPQIFLRGRLQPWRVSLSHSDTRCAAVLTIQRHLRVGVDIVALEDPSCHLQDYWFTAQEQDWCNSGVNPVVIWGLKEAIYKAIGDGSRFVPRAVDTASWLTKEDVSYLSENRHNHVRDYPLRHGARLSWEPREQELTLFFVMSAPVIRTN